MTDNPREALAQLLARLAAVPRADRPALIVQVVPLLADARVPVPTRIAFAARLLRYVPDRERAIRRIARALTVDLSPGRALHRLRQLQNQTDNCSALDSFIDRREKRVKLACPRCHKRLPRVEMVKHLWHEHGLTLELGKTRAVERVVEELQERHSATGGIEPLDRVANLTGTAGLRKWLANDEPPAEELAPLLAAASERGAGLCPACFAELTGAVAPLPEPLTLARGRLAGDGFAVEVGGNAWINTVRITTPERAASRGRRTLAPRAVATLAAAVVLIATLILARSLTFAARGVGVALFVYCLVRLLRSSSQSLADRAVDAAWSRFGSKLAERPHAARFLRRLCRASAGRGNPESRARLLSAIVQRAEPKVAESDGELQLLAAARVLQVEDTARFGRDVVGGIATLAADAFNGTLPADYAEFVIGCYLTCDRELGDLARLRVLLVGAAFDAGLVPRDLVDLWAGAPHLKRVMATEPAHRLGLLFGVWQKRSAKPWQAIGPAETAFDFARTSPHTAASVLANFPDLLLLHRTEPKVEKLLGPVLVCARGVSIGGALTSDPEAEVHLEEGGRELIFGRHEFEFPRRLPADLPELLTQWLRFRAEALLPFIEGYLSPGSGEVSRRALGPFCRRCLACGAVSAIAPGAVGSQVLS